MNRTPETENAKYPNERYGNNSTSSYFAYLVSITNKKVNGFHRNAGRILLAAGCLIFVTSFSIWITVNPTTFPDFLAFLCMLESIPFACFGIVEIRRAGKKTERNALWYSMMANLATALAGTSFLLLPLITIVFPSSILWSLLVTAIGLIPALFGNISQRKVDDKAQRFLDEKKALLQNNASAIPKSPATTQQAWARLRFKDEFAGVGFRPDELDSKTQHKHFGRRRLLLYIVIFSLLAIFLVSVWEAIAEFQALSPVSWAVTITQCILIMSTFACCYRIYLRPDYRYLGSLKGMVYLSVLFAILSILVTVFLRRFVPQTICATALTLFSIFLYRWLVANTERY